MSDAQPSPRRFSPAADNELPPERVVLAPHKRRDAVLEVIRAARRKLVLSLFRCDDFEVLDEVSEALERGVHVRILITPRAKGWGKRLKNLWTLLESMGAELRRYSGVRKYHAKYIVSDDGPALVASLNFTRKCFHKTCDFLVITHDPEVVSGLQRLFDFDWEARQGPLPEGLGERLLVGPDQARERIRLLLGRARGRLRIIDHRVTDTDVVYLLNARRAEGVTIQVQGRGSLNGLRSHGKLILVDDGLALTGSMSLSTAGMTGRREVSLLIRDPQCLRHLQDFFDTVAVAGLSEDLTPAPGEDEEEDDEEDAEEPD